MVGAIDRRAVLTALGASLTLGVPRSASREVRAATAVAGDWPQLGFDAANTGHAPGETGPTEDVGQAWRSHTGASVRSSPAVVDGTVYAGCDDHFVYAVDAADGSVRWQFETGGQVTSSPAVVDGTVYVGSGDGSVYALDAAEGTPQWRFETDGAVNTSPAVVDGTVYVGSTDATLYALDGGDGRPRWTFPTGGFPTTPGVGDGTVYVGSTDTTVYAVDAETGGRRWQTETDEVVLSAPTVADGRVFVGSNDRNLYALDASDGSILWRHGTGRSVVASPAVAGDTVYVGSFDDHLYALDVASGDQRWQTPTNGAVQASPVVVDGVVYLSAVRSRQTYGFDADSGTRLWTYQSTNVIETAPAVVDGTVYLGSRQNRLLALREGAKAEPPTPSSVDTETRTPTTTGPHGTPTGPVDPGTGESGSEGDVGPVLLGGGLLGTILLGSGLAWWYGSGRAEGHGDAESAAPDTPGASAAGTGAEQAAGDRGPDPATGAALDEQLDDLAEWVESEAGRVVDTPERASGGLRRAREDLEDVAATAAERDRDDLEARARDRLAAADAAVEAADLLAEARDEDVAAREAREAGDLARAADRFEAALDALDGAHSVAETGPVDGAAIADERAAVAADRADLRSERELRGRLGDLEERVDGALDRLAADPDAARSALEDCTSALDALASDARADGFPSIARTAGDLRARCEDHLAESGADESVGHGPPEPVPRAPDLDLSYDAIDVGDPIGQGGNADVYHATTEVNGQPHELAVKEPRLVGTLDSHVVDQFRREAETWGKLDDHDHVVGVVDYGGEPIPWIAMEYMDGGSLERYAGDLPLRQAVWTGLAITEAVYHAHRRGVAHFDLKPANVLFRTAEDAWDVPKVGDWGLAKLMLDHSESVDGYTPAYAAPEQLSEEYGSTDQQTDVYALGAVLYELFTGQPPFDGRVGEVVTRVLNDAPPRPTEVTPGLPQELSDLLVRAMEKEKADRYEDVVLLREDLRGIYDRL